ncbi:MAG: hypothetical protein J6Z25_00965 [Opitutales bacterium]|nr:hypothetical protein [Opitutales bacterium]
MTQFRKACAAAKRFWKYWKAKKHRSIYVGIADVCNAKCYYCQKGYDNLQQVRSTKKPFMEVGFFEKLVRHCKAAHFLDETGVLGLYSWNESFLHPELTKIIDVGTREHCLMSLASNGSIRPKLPENFDASAIGNISFSLCGFSQASYDKIHQLDFHQIRSNIEWMVRAFRQHGFFGFLLLRFHIYQFNVSEIEPARRWAKSLGMQFAPYYAYINDPQKSWQYLQQTLPVEYLTRVSKDLFMGYHLYRSKKVMNGCDRIAVAWPDVEGNCKVCCMNNTSIGSIFDFSSPEEMMRAKQAICQQCLATFDFNMWDEINDDDWKKRRAGKLSFSYVSQFLKTCFLKKTR